MAGHSQFKNIMFRKGAQDARRARQFARLTREVQVAVKLGSPDPAQNPRLRSAIAAARAANMPKDNIDRSIKRAAGGDADANFEDVRYEGYGPGGVAVLVEALTDNRKRTAAEVRMAFSKYGGNLGETGSVGFLFDRVGRIVYPAEAASNEAMFEAALEAGADDVSSSTTGHEIICATESFNEIREQLEQRCGPASEAELIWRPQTTVALDEDTASALLKLLEALEETDDVQNVSANFEIADDIMAKLTG